MRDALAGRDVLAKSRTGSGKTLAFAIPMVEGLDSRLRKPIGLVLVPTRELCVQVTDELKAISGSKKLRVAPVYGGVGLNAQAHRASTAQIIVATPGRLQDLIDRRMVSLTDVQILVLDEADRMLDMGFQPQVDKIVANIKGKHQTMFFSATLDGRVGNLARAYTNDPVRHEIEDKSPVIETADHRFVPVEADDKIDRLFDELERDRRLALVFVRTKRGADRLAKKLHTGGIRTVAMHGNMSQPQRQKALDQFASGRSTVMIATDVAARGLDLDGITHVFNFDPPTDHTDYVHRVGRTARAGRSGTGVTFVTSDQLGEVSAIARALKLNAQFEAEGLRLVERGKPGRTTNSHGRGAAKRSFSRNNHGGAASSPRHAPKPAHRGSARPSGAGRGNTGTVKWFNDNKGYGFIEPDDGSKDLFAHHSSIVGDGFKSLVEGARVSFESRTGPKGPEATQISPA